MCLGDFCFGDFGNRLMRRYWIRGRWVVWVVWIRIGWNRSIDAMPREFRCMIRGGRDIRIVEIRKVRCRFDRISEMPVESGLSIERLIKELVKTFSGISKLVKIGDISDSQRRITEEASIVTRNIRRTRCVNGRGRRTGNVRIVENRRNRDTTRWGKRWCY